MSELSNIIWSPVDYAAVSVLAREVGEEMLSRLEWMTLQPGVILDLGCGPGEMSTRLKERYPDAHVVAVDLSEAMIRQAKQTAVERSCLCADACGLPLQDQSVDLVFANLMFPWQDSVESLLRECHRVLRPEGLLLFSAFGPDTLKECQSILKQAIAPVFIDMHDAGDLMLQLNYADPVLDVDYYTMTYRTQTQLFEELVATGMLANTANVAALATMPPAEDGKWEVTYEVIFAHAFLPAASEGVGASADGVVRIPLSQLRKALR